MTETNTTEFKPWPKIARLNRVITITEKLDGTNAQVAILPVKLGEPPPYGAIVLWASAESPTGGFGMFAGSRTRWVTPADDNYGFAAWVTDNHVALRKLGPGRHFGEWWGRGINRNYGLTERRFSLFNTERWCRSGELPDLLPVKSLSDAPRYQQQLPGCVGLVPVLGRGNFNTEWVQEELNDLRDFGSVAVPGFMKPEGLVVFHHAANVAFKVTLENDESPKGLVG